MIGYIARRLVALLPVVVLVASVVFAIMRLAPGDPAVLMLGEDATQQQLMDLRERLGLERSIPAQYFRWLGNLLRGDLGESIFYARPVVELIAARAEPTILLTLLATLIAILIGVPLGVLAAVNKDRFLDQFVMVVAVLGFSMPNFWLGLLLILVFAVQLGWLPAIGYASPMSAGLIPWAEHMIMPAVAIGVSQAALIARLTRGSLIEVLSLDYVRTARAKGLRRRTVILKHALRNSILPTVTVIGFVVANLLAGSVISEQIFSIPGIGRLLIGSVMRRDYPVIEGTLMVVAAIYVLVNLAVDLLYARINPQIRYR